MKVILDSTAILHLKNYRSKMFKVLSENGVDSIFITRVNYLELLSGSAFNAKVETRKFLNKLQVLEITKDVIEIANKLSMKEVVQKNNQKDFLIAAICIQNNLPLVTQNIKHFQYEKLRLINYSISFLDKI